jgi:hypothetical protein
MSWTKPIISVGRVNFDWCIQLCSFHRTVFTWMNAFESSFHVGMSDIRELAESCAFSVTGGRCTTHADGSFTLTQYIVAFTRCGLSNGTRTALSCFMILCSAVEKT